MINHKPVMQWKQTKQLTFLHKNVSKFHLRKQKPDYKLEVVN